MTDFQSIWAAAAPALDQSFGEPVLVVPQRDGRYTAGADPGRPEFTVRGILDTSSKTDRIAGRGGTTSEQMDRVDEYAMVDFDLSVFSDTQWPRVGDRLRFPSRPGVPAYQVVRPGPSGQGRIEFVVVRVAT